MAFKKIQFSPYGKKARYIEINVKDNKNMVIDFFKIYNKESNLEKNQRNDNPKRVLKILKEKHGFDFEDTERKEKSWIKKDMEW